MANSQRILNKRVGYDQVSYDSVLNAPLNQQLNMHSVDLLNGTNNNMQVGFATSLNPMKYALYSYVGGVATLLTVPGSLIPATIGDGFILQSTDLTGLIAYNVTAAATGAPVYAYEYWDGTAYQPLTPIIIPALATVGKVALVFKSPHQWVPGNDGAVVGLDPAQYTLRVTATTAPTTPLDIDAFLVGKVLVVRNVEGLQALEQSYGQNQLLLAQSEGIIPIFEVADPKNVAECSYRINP